MKNLDAAGVKYCGLCVNLQREKAYGSRQITIDAHTCLRYDDNEKLIIAVAVEDGRKIPVSNHFADGVTLRVLYYCNQPLKV